MFTKSTTAILALSASLFFSACSHQKAPVAPLETTTQNQESSQTSTAPETTNDEIASSQYQTYSPAAFAAAADKRRVFFFHAAWCPTCKVLDKELLNQLDQLPSDVVVFKTDYDTASDLKKKYGITYQHTLVQVDANGETVTKWNGGGVAEIKANLK